VNERLEAREDGEERGITVGEPHPGGPGGPGEPTPGMEGRKPFEVERANGIEPGTAGDGPAPSEDGVVRRLVPVDDVSPPPTDEVKDELDEERERQLEREREERDEERDELEDRDEEDDRRGDEQNQDEDEIE
jgi:hypothetical protein